MSSRKRVALAILVFVAATLSFFAYYGSQNDHFDRLARARQIAVFGDVPFRDFFDPGYFLTLYTSALLQRLLGDNLLGELLLNVSFMAAGTTLVFLLASRISRSTVCGLIASALVVIGEPRTYDYDKVLFYPLGVYACWRYIDKPTFRSLWWLSAAVVVAGLFRYDSAIYLGAAAGVAITARHWGSWRIAGRRVALAFLAMAVLASPALIFVQATAGLGNALDQVETYAIREGLRSSMFRPVAFDFNGDMRRDQLDRSDGNVVTDAYWFPRVANKNNAVAWLYHLAVGLPLIAALILPWGLAARGRGDAAKLLAYATLAELVALCILRDPVTARIGGTMPVLVLGGSALVGEWLAWLEGPLEWTPKAFVKRGLIAGGGLTFCLLTFISVGALVWYPPKSSLELPRRLLEYAQTPTSLTLLPKGELQPLVEYVRDCTKPSDRVLATWFVGELYFFSRRGFAAGLPVVFSDHWTELRYQRRALDLIGRQSVPIIVADSDELNRSQDFLWTFITTHYELSRDVTFPAGVHAQIWARRGLPVERFWGPLALPCFAPGE